MEKAENTELKTTEKPRKYKGFTRKIVIPTGIFLVILFTVQLSLNTINVMRRNRELYYEYASSVTDASETIIEYWLKEAIDIARVFANSQAFANGNIAQIQREIRNNADDYTGFFETVGAIDPTGYMITSGGDIAMVNDRNFFRVVYSGSRDFYIDDPTTSRATGKNVVHVSVPIKNMANQITGVFVGLVPTEAIQREIERINVGKRGFAFLIATDGTYIAHYNRELIGKNNYSIEEGVSFSGLKDLVLEMRSGKEGMGTIINLSDGEEIDVFYIPVTYTGWSLAVTIPEDQVNSTAFQTLNLLIVLNTVSIILIVLMIWGISRHLIKPLKNVIKTLEEIASADADLTKQIGIRTNDEVGGVVRNFNRFTGKLREIMSELKDSKAILTSAGEDLEASTDDTHSSIEQIVSEIESMDKEIQNQAASVTETASVINQFSSNIETLEKMISQQGSSVTQSSAAVQEMIGNIGILKQSLDQMTDAFDDLNQSAQSGANLQSNVYEQVDKIKSQSETLQDANQAIADIAEQTNLLAMNAAIEAAHAGEAGKGFSVVADEIRKLSETSSEQSRTIGEQLQQIKGLIESVVDSSSKSSEAFLFVASKIQETDKIIRHAKSTMDEQQEGTRQMNLAINSMNESTTEVQNASQEMYSGNQQILKEIGRLQEATIDMKESMSNMISGAGRIQESGTVLKDISDKLKESIENMGNHVDRFKV